MNPLFVGIDVSSRSNVAYLMKPDGSKHSSFSVQNDLGGAKMLSEKIVSALRSMQLSDVVIGLEATSIYGDSLVYALREDGSLGRFQRKIHVLNPKQVKKFKEAYPDLPKNDFVDAFVIADHLRFGRIAKEVYMDDYVFFNCHLVFILIFFELVLGILLRNLFCILTCCVDILRYYVGTKLYTSPMLDTAAHFSKLFRCFETGSVFSSYQFCTADSMVCLSRSSIPANSTSAF